MLRTWSAGIGSSSEVPAQKQIDNQECHRQGDYDCSSPTSAAGLIGGFVAWEQPRRVEDTEKRAHYGGP
jgi:hypothetical protein